MPVLKKDKILDKLYISLSAPALAFTSHDQIARDAKPISRL
jgi:hypothetical protein